MSDVSGNDSEWGDTGVAEPSAFAALLSGLKGADFWDRPGGDWGPPRTWRGQELERRLHANSCYRLGSKALRIGELDRARNWLRRACEDHHPGAAFRLAVTLWRQSGPDSAPQAVTIVVSAARWGHEDARTLLRQAGWDLADIGLADRGDTLPEQDGEFIADVRTLLATFRKRGKFTARIPKPRRTGAAPDPLPANTALATIPPGGAPGDRKPGPRSAWSPAPLRHASLTHLAQQVPPASRPLRRWQSAQRVLDLLQIIASAGRAVSERHLAWATSLPHPVMQRLLVWLCQQHLTLRTPDGGYVPGPALRLIAVSEPGRPGKVIDQVLAGLRDAVGAAVYISTYSQGEVSIVRWSDGPSTPGVKQRVAFTEAAHATAVGKSLLSQLTFDQRMDHLSRHRPIALTQRTITNGAALFQNLDHHGPLAAQFDILEYSDGEVCVAVPLVIDGEIGCVALSLPVAQRHRLIQAAKILSSRSAGLLLSLLLAASPPDLETGRQDAPAHRRPGRAAAGHQQAVQRPAPDHTGGEEADDLEEEHEAQVIPFPSRTVEPPPVEPPDVLCSTNLDLSLREVAGSRS
ncbi:IclR family transcriptional regulator C-terminal domain-containing protein [Streptomyces sp. MB09-01]|uniref:IclR family transcriptional regulator domain-containing protein n=1 Tax=Streptomyces sp. MB09-01 TaxID=3028666 RepID=UPI0029A9AC3E|nr:IclR family transcriptional regulator C-terminal domain-containing protein [Streptomyces sp. MB09-01]MDX3533993.1 IclR family transcriptional regulator C-terminal domain-containing protein [Streptomyces sp. MB09-01]